MIYYTRQPIVSLAHAEHKNNTEKRSKKTNAEGRKLIQYEAVLVFLISHLNLTGLSCLSSLPILFKMSASLNRIGIFHNYVCYIRVWLCTFVFSILRDSLFAQTNEFTFFNSLLTEVWKPSPQLQPKL